MTHKEQLNRKVEQTERILKWIKALNELDKHDELANAIWFLKHFTQDIEYIYSGKNVDSCLSFWDEVDVRDKEDIEDGWDSGWVYVWMIEWVHLCTRYEDELEDFKNCERYLWNFTTFHFVRKTKKNTTNN